MATAIGLARLGVKSQTVLPEADRKGYAGL
jgi:hypothetical protein